MRAWVGECVVDDVVMVEVAGVVESAEVVLGIAATLVLCGFSAREMMYIVSSKRPL